MASKKSKLIEKEVRFVATRGRGWGLGDWVKVGNWVKVVKRYKLAVIR